VSTDVPLAVEDKVNADEASKRESEVEGVEVSVVAMDGVTDCLLEDDIAEKCMGVVTRWVKESFGQGRVGRSSMPLCSLRIPLY